MNKMSGLLLQHLKTVDSMLGSCAGGGRPPENERYALICHKKAEKLGNEIASRHKLKFEKIDVKWERFDDGTDKIVIQNMSDTHRMDGFLSNRHVFFIASFHNSADTLSQLHLLHYICMQLRPSSVTVALPFIPTGTMERIVPGSEGEVPTAATIASMFNGLPFNAGVRVMTYEIHALPIMFYFQGKSGLTIHSAIPVLLEEIGNRYQSVVFPDDGATKRFSGMFTGKMKMVTCMKKHLGGTDKQVTIEDANLTGQNVIIVDDMTRSGKTMFKCMDATLKVGAESVSMFVTHGAFTDEFWMELYVRSCGPKKDEFKSKLDKFYTTNSVCDANDEKIGSCAENCLEIYKQHMRNDLEEFENNTTEKKTEPDASALLDELQSIEEDTVKELKPDKSSPFVKMQKDFPDIFVGKKVMQRPSLKAELDRWLDMLHRPDIDSITKKIKVLSITDRIVNDLEPWL